LERSFQHMLIWDTITKWDGFTNWDAELGDRNRKREHKKTMTNLKSMKMKLHLTIIQS